MKYIIYCILLFIILIGVTSFNVYRIEGFEIDYGTGIGPWWAQGAGLNRGFNRCICYGSGDCHCINNNPFNYYPQYYFN